MTTPFISAICLEYGRPEHLTESVACFLAQDYTGEHELVILNSCNRIKYSFDHPRVRIINLDQRPESLGACRNLAIEHARGSHILTWDSDDLFLPNFISSFADSFESYDWVWINKQFSLVNWSIKSITGGTANLVGFTKSAWEKAGKYRMLGCGEDRDFIGRLTTQTSGKKIDIPPERIGFLYHWGNNAWHISGLGDDAPGTLTSYQRSARELELRVAQRKVRTGDIAIEPRMKHDYVSMARTFVAGFRRDEIMSKSVGVVLLGRYGDCVNFLPCLKIIADNYGKPHIVVSREFVSLFDGVSYVEPFPVDLDNSCVAEAIKIAKNHFPIILNAQVWGKGHVPKKDCAAYNVESWKQAGFGHLFNDKTLKPEFDRRNYAREEALFNKLDRDGKPTLLLKLDGSVSSPCPQCKILAAPIHARFAEHFNIVDLSSVRAERVFDLIGLMDRAEVLVAIDTAHIHLAAASKIKTIALVNPVSWLGTEPRCNCIARFSYTDAVRSPNMVVDAIAKALTND